MALSPAERHALGQIEIGLLAHHPRLAVTLDMESMRRKIDHRRRMSHPPRSRRGFGPRSVRELGGLLTSLLRVAPRLITPMTVTGRARGGG